LSKVDLSWLISRKSFTIPCTLSQNRCKVTTTALANTKANAFALLDTKCAKKISEFLNTLLETLERPVLVKGYNKQIGKPITSTLHIYLQINK
jgi:arsenate reductase-like glutaredoxin family protein